MTMTKSKPAKAPSEYAGLQFVTVDSPSTMDIDDAFHVYEDGAGYRLIIAIADPTRLVKPGSTEDENAKLLGATAYVRDKAVRKMLPAHISEFEGSLVAGSSRKTFLMDVRLDEALDVAAFELRRESISIGTRLNYEDIPAILQQQDHALRPMVGAAAQLSRKLLAKRRKCGALALYDLSRLLLTDEEGRLKQLARADEVIGHIVIQEFMILANSCCAAYMVAHSIPGIFRNHTAMAAAPEVDVLAATIEAWIQGGDHDPSEVQARFNTVMGRASYSASVTGHYALALGCYGHFTSPLRRYPDLVNLRQLRAHLKGLPLPYAQDQLQAIAEGTNEALERRKEERSESFKAVVARNAEQALARGSLAHLADHELAKACKLTRETENFPDVLADELIKRMNGSTITDKIVHALLVEVPHGLWPRPLKEAFATWLGVASSRALALLNYAEQTGFVRDLQVEHSGDGATFVATLSAVVAGGESVSCTGAAGRKKDAESDAAVGWICKLLGVEAREYPPKSSAVTVGNPKGALLELCQARSWPAPTFEAKGRGPSHAMVFDCVATLVVGDRSLKAEGATCASKKEAEARAAAALLSQLESVLPPAPAVASGAGSGSSSDNPVGVLNERAQRERKPLPEYTFTQIQAQPPLFRAEVAVDVEGKTQKFAGQSSTKQEAKKRAAAAAVTGLKR